MQSQDFDFSSTIAHYDGLINTHSEDHKIAGWGSKESQELRFKILTEVADLSLKSVLDVGCGLGNLYSYLQNQGITCDYLGVDINARMIAKAKKCLPEAKFETLDILTFNDHLSRYDFVLLSGVFNLGQDNHKEFVEAMIRRMYQIACEAVAFNIMSMKADFIQPYEYYARPGGILDFCLTLTRRVILRHDYMTHDFTVYMYRDE